MAFVTIWPFLIPNLQLRSAYPGAEWQFTRRVQCPVRATESAPLAPRYWQPLLDAGTDELVLRAVQPQPRRRFANAVELCEQWQRLQGGPRLTLTDTLRRFWTAFWHPS